MTANAPLDPQAALKVRLMGNRGLSGHRLRKMNQHQPLAGKSNSNISAFLPPLM